MVSGDDRGVVLSKSLVDLRGSELHAPTLAQYEVINALRAWSYRRPLKAETARRLGTISRTPIHYHRFTSRCVIEIALSLSRQKL